MYCPRCGQQQHNPQVRFCSKCGFLMAGMQTIVSNGGVTGDLLEKTMDDAISPKKRGLKQGGIMFLSAFIVVPLLGILSAIVDTEPILAGLTAIVLFWGGILRMIYALIFQSGKPTAPERAGFVESLKETFVGGQQQQQGVLPPAYQQPPVDADFQPASMNWRETADLEGVPKDKNATRPFKG